MAKLALGGPTGQVALLHRTSRQVSLCRMDPQVVSPGPGGLAAAVLQSVVTALVAVLCLYFYRRYDKRYFAWWAVAWGIFLLRLTAIMVFLGTGKLIWLYWHQVTTGWTALGLLWAALVFSRQLAWRWHYLPLALFPPVWSFIAVYLLDSFLMAAGVAVLFLSAATLWTGWVFLRHRRMVGGTGVMVLGWTLVFWGINHLNYPFLRARGVLNPWSYYLDIVFTLLTAVGIILAVHDDLRRGISAMGLLSGDLQRGGPIDEMLRRLLDRPLALPGVRGAAMFIRPDDGSPGMFVAGSGVCADWRDQQPHEALARHISQALDAARAEAVTLTETEHPFTAVLPVSSEAGLTGALVMVGDARDPFTALDHGFLRALGQQVGAALENAELYRKLELRNAELARLSARMVDQHEEERRRLARELHDETGQVFSAVRMELSVLKQSAEPAFRSRLNHVLDLTNSAIGSIRSVTHALRPTLLDDLGLVPAIRSLTGEFGQRSGIAVSFNHPPGELELPKETELALYRAVQEALTNVARHSQATRVSVTLVDEGDTIRLEVADNGTGMTASARNQQDNEPHMGLAGLRERMAALGGATEVLSVPGEGVTLRVTVPRESRTR